MIEGLEFTKYRAVLGEKNAPDFVIVTVMDNGFISWSSISEQAFNDSEYADLPEKLYEQVNDMYGRLSFSGAPDPDEA